MNFFKKLFGGKSDVGEDMLIEAGVCPNCWGKQEYDHQFVEYLKDQTRSNIAGDHTHQKAFIQQFVEDRVTGIQLKNDGTFKTCPACKVKYQSN